MKLESTTGTLLIVSVIENKGPLSFLSSFRLTRAHFTNVELKLIDLLQNYIDLYKATPDRKFVEIEIGAELPDPPTSGSVTFWADEVRKRFAVENSYTLCRDVLSKITDGDIDTAAEVASRMTRILIEGQTKTRVYSLEDTYDNILELHDQARLNTKTFGIPFGLNFLDNSSGGAQGGDLITIAARPGCLSGDTLIPILRSSSLAKTSYSYRKYPLRTAYYRFNDLLIPGAKKVENQKWRGGKAIKTYTMSCNDDGSISKNEIKNILYSGRKKVFRVTTQCGFSIKATEEHRFLIGNGIYAELKDLRKGDMVQVYSGKTTNHNTKWLPGVMDPIVSIEYVGEEDTYDIEMAGNPRNFRANDFFVHNSGKTFLLLHMALTAYESGKNVLLIPTEMSEIQYHRRIAALRNNLSINKIKFGELSSIIGTRLLKYDKELITKNEHKFYMTDASMSLGMLDVKSSAYVYKPDAIYIDGAYLLKPEIYAKSRYEMVSSVAESLKMLAKEMNIPIVATYQLNKKTEDIYQSDVVRQLSSIVIEMSDHENESETWGNYVKPKLVNITKGRDGEEGSKVILIDTKHTRIIESESGETGEADEGDRCNTFIEVDGV